MKIKKRVTALALHCGYVAPWYYGKAYRLSRTRTFIYYLKPLHLFMRCIKKTWDHIIWFLMDFMWHFGIEVLYGKTDVVIKRCMETRCWDEWNRLGHYAILCYDQLFIEILKEYWRRIKRNLWPG